MISFSGQKRIEQLASQCTFLNTHQCDEEGTYCSYDYQVCDGVANCFKAEDEDLDTCINANLFSELATIECLKADIENLEIKIRAVPCDGKRECKYGGFRSKRYVWNIFLGLRKRFESFYFSKYLF